ncbi:cupredoxin domain-containing protein [Paraglaciecola aquimarina]|uniref:Cupredoxin domain-containing protein n=1 Tax=Paraglaciecola algarum TaxID=3050085 RepID=A0ABS9DC72_9ALTE|nr:cupredoxin domain-containing protein [Paraglaciecola sp. G1-23]MCF2949241.1 cupredoxin domain-containing protein [Paraglaciecola sp. G1-23]
MTLRVFVLLVLSIVALADTASAAVSEYSIQLKDHLFYPSTIKIPAGKKVKLVIQNLDDTPEEFDSFSLNREKVLFPKQTSFIYIGPLKPGVYDFFGEYNPNTARGKVVVLKQTKGATHVN